MKSSDIQCPYCMEFVEAEPEDFGKQAECPNCGKSVFVPVPPDLQMGTQSKIRIKKMPSLKLRDRKSVV